MAEEGERVLVEYKKVYGPYSKLSFGGKYCKDGDSKWKFSRSKRWIYLGANPCSAFPNYLFKTAEDIKNSQFQDKLTKEDIKLKKSIEKDPLDEETTKLDGCIITFPQAVQQCATNFFTEIVTKYIGDGPQPLRTKQGRDTHPELLIYGKGDKSDGEPMYYCHRPSVVGEVQRLNVRGLEKNELLVVPIHEGIRRGKRRRRMTHLDTGNQNTIKHRRIAEDEYASNSTFVIFCTWTIIATIFLSAYLIGRYNEKVKRYAMQTRRLRSFTL